MPNGDTVTVQKPDGSIVKIPKSNLSIAMSMGAKVYDPSKAKPTSSPLKSFGTGFAEQYGYDPKNPVSGTIENLLSPILHPIDTIKSLSSEAQKQTPEGLLKATLASLPYLAGHEYAHAGEEFVGKMTPIVGGGLETMARGETARGLGQLAGAGTQLVGMARAPEIVRNESPELTATRAKSTATNALQEIFNEGPSRSKMEQLQEADALSTKAKLSQLDQKVKTDASGLMQKVSTTVDEKIPEGSVDGTKVANDIKGDLSQYVKAKVLRAKLPPSIQKILDEAGGGATGKSTTTRLSQNELRSVSMMYKQGLRGDDLRSALSNLGYAPKQVDIMMQTTEGLADKPKLWGFKQSMQLRTELAQELFTGASEKYPGAVRKAMYRAWQNLTDQLDSAADKAQVKPDWLRAREKYAAYMTDFYGQYDRGKYNSSPLNSSLQGDTAKDIMEPLAGKGAQKARDLLRKYKEFGSEDITHDVRRFKTNEKVMRFASPSKWDILMAAYALYRPEYGIPMFIARYGAPRLVEKILSQRAGDVPTARPVPPVIPEGGGK